MNMTPEEFMEFWCKRGVAIGDAPVIYLYDDELLDYTAKEIKALRRRKQHE